MDISNKTNYLISEMLTYSKDKTVLERVIEVLNNNSLIYNIELSNSNYKLIDILLNERYQRIIVFNAWKGKPVQTLSTNTYPLYYIVDKIIFSLQKNIYEYINYNKYFDFNILKRNININYGVLYDLYIDNEGKNIILTIKSDNTKFIIKKEVDFKEVKNHLVNKFPKKIMMEILINIERLKKEFNKKINEVKLDFFEQKFYQIA